MKKVKKTAFTDQSTLKSGLAGKPTPVTPGPSSYLSLGELFLLSSIFQVVYTLAPYFGEDQHEGLKISLTLSIVAPSGMAFGYASM